LGAIFLRVWGKRIPAVELVEMTIGGGNIRKGGSRQGRVGKKRSIRKCIGQIRELKNKLVSNPISKKQLEKWGGTEVKGPKVRVAGLALKTRS